MTSAIRVAVGRLERQDFTPRTIRDENGDLALIIYTREDDDTGLRDVLVVRSTTNAYAYREHITINNADPAAFEVDPPEQRVAANDVPAVVHALLSLPHPPPTSTSANTP